MISIGTRCPWWPLFTNKPHNSALLVWPDQDGTLDSGSHATGRLLHNPNLVAHYHFVHAPSQCETTLRCNVVSHWLGTCIKWPLWLAAANRLGDSSPTLNYGKAANCSITASSSHFQSPCTALMAAICLPLELCKETVKGSMSLDTRGWAAFNLLLYASQFFRRDEYAFTFFFISIFHTSKCHRLLRFTVDWRQEPPGHFPQSMACPHKG